MTLLISCDCGYVARGESKDELLTDLKDHLRGAHPNEVGMYADEDLLAMAEEEE